MKSRYILKGLYFKLIELFYPLISSTNSGASARVRASTEFVQRIPLDFSRSLGSTTIFKADKSTTVHNAHVQRAKRDIANIFAKMKDLDYLPECSADV